MNCGIFNKNKKLNCADFCPLRIDAKGCQDMVITLVQMVTESSVRVFFSVIKELIKHNKKLKH